MSDVFVKWGFNTQINCKIVNEAPHDKTNKMLSLIGVFAVCLIGSLEPKAFTCGQGRLWSDLVDPQADLSLRWVHRSFCLFCHAGAQLFHKKACLSHQLDLSGMQEDALFYTKHWWTIFPELPM